MTLNGHVSLTAYSIVSTPAISRWTVPYLLFWTAFWIGNMHALVMPKDNGSRSLKLFERLPSMPRLFWQNSGPRCSLTVFDQAQEKQRHRAINPRLTRKVWQKHNF